MIPSYTKAFCEALLSLLVLCVTIINLLPNRTASRYQKAIWSSGVGGHSNHTSALSLTLFCL